MVHEGLVITQAEAEDLLYTKCLAIEASIHQMVMVSLTNNQICALISFAYNLGVAALRASTLLKKLNSGDTAGATNEFLKWNNAGGKVIPGLTRRRQAERELFLS